MRLTDAQRRAIVEETARGGDIDLLVETPAAVARPALTAARLAVKIEPKMGSGLAKPHHQSLI